MLHLHHGTELSELMVQEGGAVVGNIASPYILLFSTDITYEVISKGWRHSFHKSADCDRRYFD